MLFKFISFIGFLVIIAMITWIAMSTIEVWVHNTLFDLGIEHDYATLNFYTLIFGR
jgi:hypothetical protein